MANDERAVLAVWAHQDVLNSARSEGNEPGSVESVPGVNTRSRDSVLVHDWPRDFAAFASVNTKHVRCT